MEVSKNIHSIDNNENEIYKKNLIELFKNEEKRKKMILMFDIDGTLTESRLSIKEDMKNILEKISKKVDIAAVGGSDYVKVIEQLQDSVKNFKYVFSENGLVSYLQDGTKFHVNKISENLGEENLQILINYLLNYIADLDIPKKRGTFIEYRQGMLNVSPIGRNCSQEERIEFYEYDKIHKIREKMKKDIENEFQEKLKIKCSIGGQISLDLIPIGWDKSYSLQFVEKNYDHIIFFGDKIYDGGNDYEIAIDKRVQFYFKTKEPNCTLEVLNSLL